MREQTCFEIKETSLRGSLYDSCPNIPSPRFFNLESDPAKFAQLIRPSNSPAPLICNLNPNRKLGPKIRLRRAMSGIVTRLESAI